MKQNGLGIASLVLGIIGMLTTCLVFGILPCIIGLVLGLVAVFSKKGLKGCAIAGIICSIIGIIIFAVLFYSVNYGIKDAKVSVDNDIEEIIENTELKTNEKDSEITKEENSEPTPEPTVIPTPIIEPTPEPESTSEPIPTAEPLVSPTATPAPTAEPEELKQYDSEILFNSIPWKTRYTEVEKNLSGLSLIPIYGDNFKTMSADAIALGDYEGIDFEYSDINVIANNIMGEMEVAGYTTEDVSLYFVYSTENNRVDKTFENSIFYGAQYKFEPLSLNEMSSDLKEKITSIYGKPDRTEEDGDLWGNKYEYTYWIGQNDTELVLRTLTADKDNEIYRDEIVISYIWRGGDELLQRASDLLKEEEISNEAKVYGNESTSGL